MSETNKPPSPTQSPKAGRKSAPAEANRGSEQVLDASSNDASNLFLLEDIYPNASQLFSSAKVCGASSDKVLVVFDTNALLLPYNIAADDLTALGAVYEKLAKANRLLIPARAAREFYKNRDQKLGKMLQSLNEKNSRIAIPDPRLSPLLEGIAGYEELVRANEVLQNARASYAKKLRDLITIVKEWRGNDPVTQLYARVFTKERIIEHDGKKDELLRELSFQFKNKIPPGYKDASKADGGIGDFLIWKSILKIGKLHKKDLIFVTGEGKADWFVRSNNEAVYPRPELIDQYRTVSGGKNIRLSSLYEILHEMDTPTNVVEEVEKAEMASNASIRASSITASNITVSARHRSIPSTIAEFDYSLNKGIIRLEQNGEFFDLRFFKANDESIYIYNDSEMKYISKIDETVPGDILFSVSSRQTYYFVLLTIGDVFLAEYESGSRLIGRILSIKDTTRGALNDEVIFAYGMFSASETIIVP